MMSNKSCGENSYTQGCNVIIDVGNALTSDQCWTDLSTGNHEENTECRNQFYNFKNFTRGKNYNLLSRTVGDSSRLKYID